MYRKTERKLRQQWNWLGILNKDDHNWINECEPQKLCLFENSFPQTECRFLGNSIYYADEIINYLALHTYNIYFYISSKYLP